MVHDHALCPDAAGTWAGVYAFLIVAGHVGRAVGAEDALGSAIWWRAQVARYAGADCLIVYLSALAVGPTG